MNNQEQDLRITAPVPRRWRRVNPLPQPTVVVNTFDETVFDQQLVNIDTVTNDLRERIRIQNDRFAGMDDFFQMLIPRIRHVLAEMLASHDRDIEEVARVFQAALIIAQTERDRIAISARASMTRSETLAQMQRDYLERLDEYLDTLAGDTTHDLRAILWDGDDEQVQRNRITDTPVVAPITQGSTNTSAPTTVIQGSPAPLPNYPSDGENSPETVRSYATIGDARQFISEWNVLLQEARQRAAAANIPVYQFLRNQQALFNRGNNDQNQAEFDAVLRAFTSVYGIPETLENVERLMQENYPEVLGNCENEQLRAHPNGLIIRDGQGECHDLIEYAESVASRGGREPFIITAGNIVMGYNLLARLLAGPGNMHVRYDFADAILRQYELPQTRSNQR